MKKPPVCLLTPTRATDAHQELAIAVIRQVSEGTHPDSKDFKEKVARRMGVLAAEGIMFAQSVAEKIEQAVKVEQAGKN